MHRTGDRHPSAAVRSTSSRHVTLVGHLVARAASDERAAPSPCIVDDWGRTWQVREIESAPQRRAWREFGLMFCCDAPGAIPQLRRAWRPLGRLSQGELLEVLQRGD